MNSTSNSRGCGVSRRSHQFVLGLICGALLNVAVCHPLAAALRYQDAVGEPPVPTSLAFKSWLDRLVAIRLASVPPDRSMTYYFSQAGDDLIGDGSIATPWKSLDKAQSILNQHARTTNASGLSLRFRGGDIWRQPVVLRASIASISGVKVLLSPAPDWSPQPSFTYELRGGSVTERIEARSYNPATGELMLQWEPVSSDHGEIYFECALMIASPHVTVSSYHEPSQPALGKVRFTRFVPAIPWQDHAVRGDGHTNAYSFTINQPVAWIRTMGVLNESFRRVHSVDEVAASAGTWFADGSRVWAHEWLDTPMTGGLNTYEYVLENRWDGVCVADVDDVRIDAVVADGWGMTAQASGEGDQRHYGGYGFRATASGSNHVAFTGCEAYYNNRHCMGNVTAHAGGIWTAAWCSWGYCVEGGSAVSYAWGGENESLFYECVNRAGGVLHGVKPYARNSAIAGYSHHAHTSGGTKKVGLFISYRCRTVPAYTMAGHCGPTDLPSAANIRDCRSFVVEDRYAGRTPTFFDRTKPSSDNTSGLLRPGLVSNTTYVNCWFDHTLLWAAGNWVPLLNGTYANTRLLNCGLTYTALADDYYLSTPNIAWETVGLSAYNCHFDANLGTGRSFGYVGRSAAISQNTFKNCVLTFHGVNYQDSGTAVRMRCVNTAEFLANNYYGGFTTNSGPDGYDADPWRLEGAPVLPGAIPDAASELISGHAQFVDGTWPLEYDFHWRTRFAPRTAIGPMEALSVSDSAPQPELALQQVSGAPVLFIHASRPCRIGLEYTDALTTSSEWRRIGPFELTSSPMTFVDPVLMTNTARIYRAVAW